MGIFRLLPQAASLQTDDGDTSFEAFALATPRDFPLQNPLGIVPSDGVISQIVVGWRAKDPGGDGDQMRAGIRSGGVRQFGASQILDATGYFPTFEDIFTVDASDSQPWTFAKLQAAEFTGIADTVIGSPDPRITFAYVDVHAVTPPSAHITGDPSTTFGGAAASSDFGGAGASADPPKGIAS